MRTASLTLSRLRNIATERIEPRRGRDLQTASFGEIQIGLDRVEMGIAREHAIHVDGSQIVVLGLRSEEHPASDVVVAHLRRVGRDIAATDEVALHVEKELVKRARAIEVEPEQSTRLEGTDAVYETATNIRKVLHDAVQIDEIEAGETEIGLY